MLVQFGDVTQIKPLQNAWPSRSLALEHTFWAVVHMLKDENQGSYVQSF